MVTQPLEHFAMLAEIALQGEDANAHGIEGPGHGALHWSREPAEGRRSTSLPISVDKRGCTSRFV
jgi:hypothetical protein